MGCGNTKPGVPLQVFDPNLPQTKPTAPGQAKQPPASPAQIVPLDPVSVCYLIITSYLHSTTVLLSLFVVILTSLMYVWVYVYVVRNLNLVIEHFHRIRILIHYHHHHYQPPPPVAHQVWRPNKSHPQTVVQQQQLH
jgi:hypothetical protein